MPNPRSPKTETTTPPSYAETTPYTNPDQHSFVLQGIMELQKGFGRMEAGLESVEKSVEKGLGSLDQTVSEQAKEIDKLKKTVWTATAVFLVVSAIAGIIASNNYAKIVRFLTPAQATASSAAAPTAPAPPAAAATTLGQRQP